MESRLPPVSRVNASDEFNGSSNDFSKKGPPLRTFVVVKLTHAAPIPDIGRQKTLLLSR
jgi:hypothetical protein